MHGCVEQPWVPALEDDKSSQLCKSRLSHRVTLTGVDLNYLAMQ